MPMSALTAPMTGSRTSAPAITTSSSESDGRPWVALRSEGLGVAPDRLVAGGLAVALDADPQVRVAEAHVVVRGRAEACETLGRGEAFHRNR